MTFIGHETKLYAKVLFVIYASLSAGCFFINLYFFKNLKIFGLYLVPLLCFCLCYENIALFYGSRLSESSIIANVAYALHSLEIPLFIVAIYELCYRLHEARTAHFCCIRFDQGNDVNSCTAVIGLWGNRLLAIGLLIMNVFVDFRLIDSSTSYLAGRGGYIALNKHRDSLLLWLNLIPPMLLSAIGISMSIILYRYSELP